MLFSFLSRLSVSVLLALSFAGSCFGETVELAATPVNTVQIKALKIRPSRLFEIQLGGGANQPPVNATLVGKATMVVGNDTHAGHFRISTDPTRQLRMALTSTNRGKDEYRFMSGNDMLFFEFAPTSSFARPWLTGNITSVSATQQRPRNGGQNSGNQNKQGQNNGGQNNHNQNGQNGGGQNNGNEHPPIVITGKLAQPAGGTLAKYYGGGEATLMLDVGGNQSLSVVTPGDTLSGMSLKQGSYYEAKRR